MGVQVAFDHEKLSPGDETWVSEQDVRPKLHPDDRWEANIHRYQLYSNLMLAGSRVLHPPAGTRHPIRGGSLADNSYLVRLPAETSFKKRSGEDAFQERQDSGAHDPVAARIIWCYVDTLFRQAIDRDSVRSLLGDEVLDNVDLRGTSADDWLPSAYAQGLAQGWLLGLVDMPLVEESFPSLLHEERSGHRPYLQLILPSRVWELERDQYGQVTRALIQEGQKSWREWTETETRLLDERGEVIEPAVKHGFNRVPMCVFVANDPDPDDPNAPPGESAMATTALIDLRILQHMSLLDDVQRKTGFPLLHVRLDQQADDPQADLTIGPDLAYCVEADVQWIAPPPTCPQEVRAHIDWLESMALKVGGVHRRSMDSVEAHSGLALDWENAPIYATVMRWASRLRTWELQLWRLVAEASGQDPSGLRVVYPDDFSSRPVEQDLGQAKATGEIFGGYGQAPGWAQAGICALVRRALNRSVGHLPEMVDALGSTYQEHQDELLSPPEPVLEPVLPPAELEDEAPPFGGADE